MPLRLLVPVAGIILALSLPAAAEWSYSAFTRDAGTQTAHIAVTAHEYHGVGLRCEDGALSIQYLTNDPMTDAQMEAINASGVRLALRTGDDARRIEGEMQRVPQGAIFVARTQTTLLASLEDADGTMQLALEYGGATTHERSFALEGAAEALGSIRRNCLG